MDVSRVLRTTSPSAAVFVLNRNHIRRDEILGTTASRNYYDGLKPFTGLGVEKLRQLMEEQFIHPAARQGRSPPAAHFLRFMQRWPQVVAHGYAVSRRRKDYRVTIVGIECDLSSVPASDADKLREEFRLFCHGADEYDDEGSRLFAWWD